MATCSLAELLAQAQANCFTCIGDQKLFQGLVLQLLCNISANGGGGGGGSQTPWTSDIDAAGFDLSNLGLINGVKVYRALLSQTDTSAPVATVLENSLGGTVVWSYDSVGTYFGTLVGAFPDGKVFVMIGQRLSHWIESGRNGDDSVYIQTQVLDGGATPPIAADNALQVTSIEIRVYP